MVACMSLFVCRLVLCRREGGPAQFNWGLTPKTLCHSGTGQAPWAASAPPPSRCTPSPRTPASGSSCCRAPGSARPSPGPGPRAARCPPAPGTRSGPAPSGWGRCPAWLEARWGPHEPPTGRPWARQVGVGFGGHGPRAARRVTGTPVGGHGAKA